MEHDGFRIQSIWTLRLPDDARTSTHFANVLIYRYFARSLGASSIRFIQHGITWCSEKIFPDAGKGYAAVNFGKWFLFHFVS